jgi:hypothetical protein
MATQYEGVKKIVHINTDVSGGCGECGEWIKGENLDDAVNHYVQKHDYKLLHVGTQTSNDRDGKPWHSTVAVVGK